MLRLPTYRFRLFPVAMRNVLAVSRKSGAQPVSMPAPLGPIGRVPGRGRFAGIAREGGWLRSGSKGEFQPAPDTCDEGPALVGVCRSQRCESSSLTRAASQATLVSNLSWIVEHGTIFLASCFLLAQHVKKVCLKVGGQSCVRASSFKNS